MCVRACVCLRYVCAVNEVGSLSQIHALISNHVL